MGDSLGFVGKVVLGSAVGAIAIKYGGPYLQLPPTDGMALSLVLLPPGVMAGLLIWRSQRQSPDN